MNPIDTIDITFESRLSKLLPPPHEAHIPIGVVKSYDGLKRQLGKSNVTGTGGAGSFNRIEKFPDITIRSSIKPSKYAVQYDDRDGKYTVFFKFPSNFRYLPPDIRDKLLEDSHDQIEVDSQTNKNWILADLLSICPKIYFYGYFIKNGYLHSVIVSKSYQYDLSEYYKKGPGKDTIQPGIISQSNTEIANQLITCLTKMARQMNLICFDIKPLNAVVNVDGDNVDVKLIDWDGDWCQDYSNMLKKKSSDTDQTDKIISLIVLTMANLFISHIGCNIFYPIFVGQNGNKGYLEENQIVTLDENGNANWDVNFDALEALYCTLKDPDGKRNSFKPMANHYMFGKKNTASCSDIFDKLVKRAYTPYPRHIEYNLYQSQQKKRSRSSSKSSSKSSKRSKKGGNKTRTHKKSNKTKKVSKN